MNSNFEKLHTFSFDVSKLFEEWERATIAETATKSMYVRTAINYSSNQSPHIGTYQPDLIVPSFRNSYTQYVITDVSNWLADKGLRCTKIKYAALKPGHTIPEHTDVNYANRYHLTVQVNDDCSMTINQVSYPLIENCTLYRMLASVPHSASNLGSTVRLLITFDVD